jgi:hypothetical protein
VGWFDDNDIDASGGGRYTTQDSPPWQATPGPAGPGYDGSGINPQAGLGTAAGAAQAGTAAPQAGQFANSQQGFLDWATQKYGQDPTRGGGFVNAAAGGGLQNIANQYAQATGNTAKFLGGPSGDRMDFGSGVSDALTSGGQIWNPGGGGGAASGAAGGYASGGGYGSMGGSSSSGGRTGGSVALPTAPTYQAFDPGEKFVAPTDVTQQNDPGYQFRAKQQSDALEHSAAAKGMLRTNNTWQALQDQSGQLASQEYGNVYNRAAGQHQQNISNAFQANQANNQGALGNYNSQVNAALGLGNLNLGYQNSAQSYDLGQGQLGLGYQNSNNAYALGMGNLGLQQQGQQFGQGLSLNQNAWGQNMDLARLGNPGAANSQGYGGDQAGIYGQQGNANAAGIVGAQNAWTGATNNLANIGMQAYGTYAANQNPWATPAVRM